MIRSIELFNAGPFRGEHKIDLDARAYAITARHDNDPQRSNGFGKSFLFEMINFALTGRFAKFRGYDADGWITHGEREARVCLVLDAPNGIAMVTRWRKRGQATQVRFQVSGSDEASQAQAEAAVLRFLNFDADDLQHVAYFEQRKMARLIHADPASRLEIISGWLGLGLAERAEERAGEEASDRRKEIDKLIAQRDALKVHTTTSITAEDVKLLEAEEKKRHAEYEEAKSERTRASTYAQAKKTIEEATERIKRGKRLKEQLEAAGDYVGRAKEAETVLGDLLVKEVQAREEVRKRRKVALGMFDGQCPVANIECPATEAINADRGAAQAALDSAITKHKAAEENHAKTRAELAPKIDRRVELQAIENEIERLRQEVKKNASNVREANAVLEGEEVDARACAAREDETREVYYEAKSNLARARERLDTAQRAQAEIEGLGMQIEEGLGKIGTVLKARSIFRAAQRRVAERALGPIEAEANQAIADAGVDLQIAARWEREGKGPAKTCDECGAAFPATRKVKACESCGAPRGMLTTQRLDLVLSDRSGALDDLAGIAMQMSAGSWLLAARQSPWATVMIDEPFGAMDPAIRHGLSRYLSRVIGRAGVVRQMLVISHSPETVDALPGRITIVVDDKGNRRIEQ